MDDEVRTWLKDIEQAIIEINLFLPEVKNFTEFQSDLKTKRAVERNVEIIGEAVSRILKVDPAVTISRQPDAAAGMPPKKLPKLICNFIKN